MPTDGFRGPTPTLMAFLFMILRGEALVIRVTFVGRENRKEKEKEEGGFPGLCYLLIPPSVESSFRFSPAPMLHAVPSALLSSSELSLLPGSSSLQNRMVCV